MHSFFAKPTFGHSKALRVLLIALCNLAFIALLAVIVWQLANYQSRESIQLLTQRGATMIEQSLHNAYTELDQIAKKTRTASCQDAHADLQKISAATSYVRAIYIADKQSQRIFCSSVHANGKVDFPLNALINGDATQEYGIAWLAKSLVSDREALVIYRQFDNNRIIIGVLDSQYYKDILQLVMGLRVKTITLRVGNLQLINHDNNFVLTPPTQIAKDSILISIKDTPVKITAEHSNFQLKKYIETDLPLAFLLAVIFIAWSSRYIWRSLGENNNFRQQVITAIQQQQFIPYYQPIIGLHGATSAAEVLIRWQHPALGILGPGIFIQKAEEQALLTPIMLSLIGQIEKDLSKKPIPDCSRIGINITPKQLHDQAMLDSIFSLNTTLKYLNYQLVIELTEEGLIIDPEVANKIIEKMNRAGIMVAIDDFGIGHSSLSSLSHFTFHSLKIDKSFIDYIATRKKDQIIVANMIDIARQLNLKIVAEGVETKDQADYLAIMGVDYLQGFYFSKPLAITELVHFKFSSPSSQQYPYFN